VPCIDSQRRLLALGLFASLALGGCGSRRSPAPSAPSSPGLTQPAASGRARDWDDYRRNVGLRLVAANPDLTYTGFVPEPLLAIPVLEIELNGDGSLRNLSVLRRPSQAFDTVDIALGAVRRAAPFGDCSHLPRPWRVAEAFLFRDDRRFKPRFLDAAA
jgi:hypothetical protein